MRRLLIIGCGDVALRMVPLVRCRIYALSRNPQRFGALREPGITPIRGDLDRPGTLDPIAGLAHDVVHFAPPPDHGASDTRTAHLVAALAKGRSLPQQVVDLSTSGVYGDCNGERVADRFGLPRPRRIPRALAARERPGNLLSFMSESRRLINHRVKNELRFHLRYPTVDDGIAAALASRQVLASRVED